MVIQPNMKVKDVINVWGVKVEEAFIKYRVSNNDQFISKSVETHSLQRLLDDLNEAIGSTNTTCIAGG
jgi:hypothetical protein